MGQGKVMIDLECCLQQRSCVTGPIHLDVGVGKVKHRLHVLRIVREFRLEFLNSFRILFLRPVRFRGVRKEWKDTDESVMEYSVIVWTELRERAAPTISPALSSLGKAFPRKEPR